MAASFKRKNPCRQKRVGVVIVMPTEATMAANRITVTVEGGARDKGHVRLNAFLKELDAVKNALAHTDRVVTGSERPSVYYRIIDLRHSSPATIVLEAVPLEEGVGQAERVVGTFFQALTAINLRKPLPATFDLAALESYRGLTGGLKRELSFVKISNGSAEVPINEAFAESMAEVIGPDELAQGLLNGMMEKVNVHNTSTFVIYPFIGPKQVKCDFDRDLLDKVREAIGSYVCVYGTLRYKSREQFPHAIDVESIEIYPSEGTLPTLGDLRGIAPDATGGLSAGEFTRKLRDENWDD